MECRICKCNEVFTSNLISPCKCPGLCHRSCLETDKCEICNFEYKLEYKLPSILAYSASIDPYGHSVFKGRCSILLLSLVFQNTYEVVYAYKQYYDSIQDRNLLFMRFYDQRFWHFVVISGFVVLLFILSVFFGLRETNNYFKAWQQSNKIWFVADQLSPEQQSLQYNPHRQKTSSPLEPEICRICSSEQENELIKPCKCSGKCHRGCLDNKTDHCEICDFKYKTEYQQKTFSDYLREKGYKGKRSGLHKKHQDKCNPYVHAIVFLILLPILVYSFFASIAGLIQAEKECDSFEDGQSINLHLYYQLKRLLYVAVLSAMFNFSLNTFCSSLWLNWKDFKSWQEQQEKTLIVVDQLSPKQPSHWRMLAKFFSRKCGFSEHKVIKKVESSSYVVLMSEISAREDDSASVNFQTSTSGLINENFIDV